MYGSIDIWILLVIALVYIVMIASCIVVVLSENRNPIRSLSWVVALIFLPGIGLIFYLFFGRSLRGEHMISRHNRRRMINTFQPNPVSLDSQPLSAEEKSLVKLARNLCTSFYTVNNEIEIFTDGRSKFEAMFRDLEQARESIYIQYYIFLDDELGHRMADLLIRKAREGLEVKVIYDHVGSFSAKRSFFTNMNRNGVETHPFFKVTFPQLANRINWRNHRKVTVIDRRIGYIGGMNVADRYIDSDGIWRDTHFRVTGNIIDSMLASFLVDWNFKNPGDRKISIRAAVAPSVSNRCGMQLITSGPLGHYDNIALCFLKAISSATKRIYIQTPYFLPTDALLHALEAAALAKIDVRIMIPRRTDSKMLRYASFSYVTQCLIAGIKIYLYDPGMLHAKAMIIDDTLVTAGSTNFDFRSFENNFECNLIVYDRDFNIRMRDIFFEDLGHCTKLTLPVWHRRPLGQRILESIVRLVSPIL